MKCEWIETTISDFSDINPKETLIKGQLAKKIGMEKLQPFCRDITSFDVEPFSGGAKFRNGDTVMARITPCLENGKTSKVNILEDGEVAFGSTEYIVFRAKEGVSDPDFLYYLICSPYVREIAIKSMVGSSGRQRVQQDVVANTKITVPEIKEQRIIGSYLKMFDDQIALHKKANALLDEQARALYDAWFVRYIPFDGVCPKDWDETELGRIAEIKTASFNPTKNPGIIVEHYSIPSYDDKHYPVFEDSSNIKSNKYVLNRNSLLISKLNPETKRIWRPLVLTEMAVCSTEFIVFESKKRSHKDYLYSIMNSDAFSNYLCSHVTGSTGSRQRAIPKETLKLDIVLPSERVIEDFCRLVTPLYDLIDKNLIEIEQLTQARNQLLPKLISGQLDLSEVCDMSERM